MEREGKKENRAEEELEKTLYSTLNVGSFLEHIKERTEAEKKEKEWISIEEKNVKEKVSPEIEKKQSVKEFEQIPKEEEKLKKEVSEKEVEQKIETEKEEKLKDTTIEEKKENTKEVVLKKEEKEILLSEDTLDEMVNDMIEEDSENKKNKEIEISEVEVKESEEKVDYEENHKKQTNKIGKKLLVIVIVCIVLDFFALTGLFLTYGPISYFRNLLVTSAMTTQSHKYLARTFYSEKTIKKVLASNTVKESKENTDTSDIKFDDSEDTGEYESIYEEQILKREKDQLYKVIDIKGDGYVGYLVAVYDASRVQLVGATSYGYGGALPTEIAKKNKAEVLINASGFVNAAAAGKGSMAVGTVIMDGKIVVNDPGVPGYGGGIAGFNKDHILVLTRDSARKAIQNGIVDAVEFGPFLIVNGESAQIKGNGGWGVAPRTVLAQRKDGIVLFLVIDGRNAKHSLGADMNELIEILERYKAHNAVNLDGGGSSSLVVEGKLTNIPCGSTCGERYIPNAWIVK